MLKLIEYSILVALVTCFIILLAYKTGIIEWVQVHGSKLFAELFNCEFCMSFWISIILTSLLLVFITFTTGNFEPIYLLIPILSTPITRFLL